MEDELGIDVWDWSRPLFLGPSLDGEHWATSVREGFQTLVTSQDWEHMPSGTQLSGYLYVRDRVYGRFTQALLPDGRRLPVCFETFMGGETGAPLDYPRPGVPRTYRLPDMRAVRRFE